MKHYIITIIPISETTRVDLFIQTGSINDNGNIIRERMIVDAKQISMETAQHLLGDLIFRSLKSP